LYYRPAHHQNGSGDIRGILTTSAKGKDGVGRFLRREPTRFIGTIGAEPVARLDRRRCLDFRIDSARPDRATRMPSPETSWPRPMVERKSIVAPLEAA